MIVINNDTCIINGNLKEVLAQCIYAIKELQKDWKKHGREEMFKRIIRDCLDAKELERK